ncbi:MULTISPECIES: SUKH-4 family immunity protein [Streptomyces]|uniref:SUKH-4 family immunity protein n=1 Tax=Streptomyces xanthii TaxID=2768069 RepID=A0A7H1BCT0_9ACTN|nr:SUKH-4 family immunity protein [Streptomyces xanthii]QNS06535.1 SUKH-4 family immunity protein [Streptomyces xanthii]
MISTTELSGLAELSELAAGKPSAAWLESCFGAGSLWRPSPADLPAALTHEPTRAFLTEVGVPAVRLGAVDYDSAKLTDEGMWEADPDELFGERTPDDDSPPSRYSYCIGTGWGVLHLMVCGDSGTVEVYDPDGWDHAAGYGGYAADSVPEFLVALGVFTLYRRTFEDAEPQAALDGLDELTSVLNRLRQGPDFSDFWETRLEEVREDLECELDD